MRGAPPLALGAPVNRAHVTVPQPGLHDLEGVGDARAFVPGPELFLLGPGEEVPDPLRTRLQQGLRRLPDVETEGPEASGPTSEVYGEDFPKSCATAGLRVPTAAPPAPYVGLWSVVASLAPGRVEIRRHR